MHKGIEEAEIRIIKTQASREFSQELKRLAKLNNP